MRVEGGLKLERVLSTSIDTIAEAPFPLLRPVRPHAHVARSNTTTRSPFSTATAGTSAGGPDGLFDHDTRYLSRLELLINGMHGDAKLPDLFRTLADCLKARSASVYDRCRGL